MGDNMVDYMNDTTNDNIGNNMNDTILCMSSLDDDGFRYQTQTQSGDRIVILTMVILYFAWTTDHGFRHQPRIHSGDGLVFLTGGDISRTKASL